MTTKSKSEEKVYDLCRHSYLQCYLQMCGNQFVCMENSTEWDKNVCLWIFWEKTLLKRSLAIKKINMHVLRSYSVIISPDLNYFYLFSWIQVFVYIKSIKKTSCCHNTRSSSPIDYTFLLSRLNSDVILQEGPKWKTKNCKK